MKRTRVFYSDNGTLTDYTTGLGKYRSGAETIAGFIAAEDYLYIGNVAPFNHFYIKLGATANTTTTTMSIEYWGGREWESTVEIIDETDGLQQSGFVTFVPDRNEGWHQEDTSGSGSTITGLTSIVVYDLYWARIKLSADMDPNVILSWIGQKFSNDDDMNAEYVDLNRSDMKTAYEAGKTDWEEQHVRAAEVIIKELISSNIVWSKNQVLERQTFMLPSVSKCAEIIYSGFGDDYADQKETSRKEYKSRLNLGIYNTDINKDGKLDEKEMRAQQGFFSR